MPLSMSATAGEASTASPRKRLAILDDHIVMLDGLAKWVQVNAPDFEVVAAAGSWVELVDALPRQLDVVIMAQDVDGPVGVQARIQVCVAAGAKVIIMSTIDSPETRAESLDAGATEFVSKARPAVEVLSAARRSLGSKAPLEAQADEFQGEDSANFPEFSDTEIATLRLYSQGYSTVDIALAREVRFDAVRSTLKRIRELYRLQNRQAVTRDELRRRAAEDGYLA